MLSELASLVPLDIVMSSLLEPFVFRPFRISSEEGSYLLESIQMIMNNGNYDSNEIPALHDKLCSTIKEIHRENDYMIEGKYPKEYCAAIAKPGFWPDALQFLSKIFSVKFYVYKIVDGSVEPQPLGFGDDFPYLHSCAYLIFNNDSQHYEPLCLFNSKDVQTIIKTKFLIHSPVTKLLENFVSNANSAEYQIARQVSEGNEENSEPDMQLNNNPLDQNSSQEEVYAVLQNELVFLLSVTERGLSE
ncbi:unnamed protein product, partial [Rotaria sordida]